jgi:hypothetical protein
MSGRRGKGKLGSLGIWNISQLVVNGVMNVVLVVVEMCTMCDHAQYLGLSITTRTQFAGYGCVMQAFCE